MAKQKGIFPMEGTIDNITFFKTKDGGYQARKKSGVSTDRILNDPKYLRTREHMAEFGRAGVAGKLIRTALLKVLVSSKDSRMSSRLTGVIMAAQREDASNRRGQRTLLAGNLAALEGFDFNLAGPLLSTFITGYTASIDAASGRCFVEIPEYIPEEVVKQNKDATHYRLRIGAAAIDFETSGYETATSVSDYYPVAAEDPVADLTLELTLPTGKTKVLILALTIEYIQEAGGIKYPLKNGELNACAIVKVAAGE